VPPRSAHEHPTNQIPEGLEHRLKTLLKDYQDTTKQLAYTPSAVDLNKLKRQIKSLERYIEQVENELDALDYAGGKMKGMPDIRTQKRQILEKQLEALWQDYEAAIKQTTTALDRGSAPAQDGSSAAGWPANPEANPTEHPRSLARSARRRRFGVFGNCCGMSQYIVVIESKSSQGAPP
jgi:hypothetical protein